MKGDGKPVSFIEDCAVPLEHLADYVDRADARCSAKHGTRGHVVRARVGGHAARAADPRHAPRRRGEDARDRRGGARDGARVQGRVSPASTATASCRSEWVAWQFGAAARRARSREIKALFDPAGLMNPGKIVAPAADGRRDAVPLPARRTASLPVAPRARLVGVERRATIR